MSRPSPAPVSSRPVRAVLDASDLPVITFGSRSLVWWGTVGFIVIEGFTLLLTVGAYFYIRLNFDVWPPYGTPQPSLLIPTINLALMLLSCVPMYIADKAAKRLDIAPVRLGLVATSLLSVGVLILRYYEFYATNTHWDTNAYGSVVWNVLGFHAALLLMESGEVWGTAAMSYSDKWSAKHFSAVSDTGMYWYFMMGIWVPLYFVIDLLPRIW